MRRKAEILMAGILVSVISWVVFIVFVVRPFFWVGAVLAIVGGVAMGAVVSYLILRWWLWPPLAERMTKMLKESSAERR